MKKKPKTIYKAQYVIDIEFTDQPYPKGISDEELAEVVNIKLVSAHRDFGFDNVPRDFSLPVKERRKIARALAQHEKFDYVEKHFPTAVLSLYFQMLWLEALSMNNHQAEDFKRLSRSATISQILDLKKEELQKRLPVATGRIRTKDKYFYHQGKAGHDDSVKGWKEFLEEKKTFVREFIEARAAILAERGTLKNAKMAIAGRMYPMSDNAPQDLRRKLELFEYSFEELMDAESEQELFK